jgi:hypothetical protein
MDWFNNTIVYPGMEKRLLECDVLSTKLKECKSKSSKFPSVSASVSKSSFGGWFLGRNEVFTSSPPAPTCNSEAHMLWSCRALAVGCSGEVKALQACRKETKGECKSEQVDMGKCIMDKREAMREYVKGKRKEKVGGE